MFRLIFQRNAVLLNFYSSQNSEKDGCTKILSSPTVLNFDNNKTNIYNILNISK